MTTQVTDHSFAVWSKVWSNWAQTTATHAFSTAKVHMGNAHRQVQQIHMSFFESCAQGLNSQLKNMIDSGDVKATKAILFNTTTVVTVATVALYVLGGVSFLGAAALIALSLAGRTTILQSFKNESLVGVIEEDSIGSYLEPEKLLEAGGYPVFYNMNPIITIFQETVQGHGKNLHMTLRYSKDF